MASAPIVYYPIPLAGFIGYTRMLLPPIIVPIIYHPILLQPKHTDHPQETISSLLAYWPSTINSFSWESIRSNSTSCRKESWRKKGLHLLSLFCQTHTHTSWTSLRYANSTNSPCNSQQTGRSAQVDGVTFPWTDTVSGSPRTLCIGLWCWAQTICACAPS